MEKETFKVLIEHTGGDLEELFIECETYRIKGDLHLFFNDESLVASIKNVIGVIGKKSNIPKAIAVPQVEIEPPAAESLSKQYYSGKEFRFFVDVAKKEREAFERGYKIGLVY